MLMVRRPMCRHAHSADVRMPKCWKRICGTLARLHRTLASACIHHALATACMRACIHSVPASRACAFVCNQLACMCIVHLRACASLTCACVHRACVRVCVALLHVCIAGLCVRTSRAFACVCLVRMCVAARMHRSMGSRVSVCVFVSVCVCRKSSRSTSRSKSSRFPIAALLHFSFPDQENNHYFSE